MARVVINTDVKLGEGTLTQDAIPNIPASKITSGAFDVDRIPGLAASKITSGTINKSRLPAIVAMSHGSGSTGTFTETTTALAGVTYYVKSVNINFGRTFSEVPVVACKLKTTAPHYTHSAITNVTTTGFMLTVTRANTVSTSYDWDAIGLV